AVYYQWLLPMPSIFYAIIQDMKTRVEMHAVMQNLKIFLIPIFILHFRLLLPIKLSLIRSPEISWIPGACLLMKNHMEVYLTGIKGLVLKINRDKWVLMKPRKLCARSL